MVQTCYVRSRGGNEQAAGFTLIEMLVALAVLSVATSVFITLFSECVALGNLDRSRQIGSAIAEQRLAEVAIDPSAYTWPSADTLASELVPLEFTGELSPQIPATLPTLSQMNDRERTFYGRFTSQLYVRKSDAAPGLCEVTAVVRWQNEGKDRSLSLVTLMAVPAAGGTS